MSSTDSTPGEFNPASLRYASLQHRLGAYAVDFGLAFLTLGIGWLIWSMIIWGEGQTPAKKILKLRTINATTGRPASWGHMGLREILVPLTVFFASIFTSGLAWIAWVVLEIVMYFNQGSRTLRDLWVKTAVVNEA